MARSTTREKWQIREMVTAAFMAAILCLLSPFSIPIGPVPVTLGVLAVLLCAYLLPKRQALLAVLLYLLIGCAGVPVFSGFTGGVGRLFGPTGGYLIGYLPMVWIAAWSIEKVSFHEGDGAEKPTRKRTLFFQIVGMLLGLAALYALGTLWFIVYMNTPALYGAQAGGMTIAQALRICVLPFLPIDLLKIVLAALLGNPLRMRLQKFQAIR